MKLTIDWQKKAEKQLLGRKIVALRWLSSEEAEGMDWWNRPIVLLLDDGKFLIPQSDDEGNDGGTLWIHDQAKKDRSVRSVMPVMGLNDIEKAYDQ